MHFPVARLLLFLTLGGIQGGCSRGARPLFWRSLMPRVLWSTFSRRSATCRWLVFGLLATGGERSRLQSHEAKIDFTTVSKPPAVQVINPPVRTIVRVVGQPSFIESYERSSVFPKLTGYIEKWNVDIGDRVKKGDTLATLFVPELVEDYETKKATVELDKQRIELAIKKVARGGKPPTSSRLRLPSPRPRQSWTSSKRWSSAGIQR